MKYVIISDTHLGIKKGNERYIQVYKDFIDFMCEYISENDDISGIIHTGDFFDTRESIKVKLFDVAYNSIDKMLSYVDVIYLIVGNHDSFYKNSIIPTSLSIFNRYDNIVIIDKPYMHDSMLMVPWLTTPEDIHNIHKYDTCKYCLGHFDINGMIMNYSGTTSLKDTFKVSDFKMFDMVLSGHFHIRSKSSNIIYVGSHAQFTFNEMGGKHGFHVLDTERGTLDFVEFDKYPKHIIIKDTDQFDKDTVFDNNIKFVFSKNHGIEGNAEFINRIREYEPNSLVIDYFGYTISNDQDDDNIQIEILDKRELLVKYIENDLENNKNDIINLDFVIKLIDMLYKK